MGRGLSNFWAPMDLVARLLPGWKTLLQTFSFLADNGVAGEVGVVGVAGVPGMDMDLWKLLLSPSPSTLTAHYYIKRLYINII